MTATCWATPLTHDERDALAVKLGAWCRQFHAAARVAHRLGGRDEFMVLAEAASADMSDLHLDVTERAA